MICEHKRLKRSESGSLSPSSVSRLLKRKACSSNVAEQVERLNRNVSSAKAALQ
jgi:hypothetical protein